MRVGQDEIELAKKVIEVIPANAWEKLAVTATETIEKSLAPITETTSGIGRVIRQTFDGMIDIEKIVFAVALQRVSKRIQDKKATVRDGFHLGPLIATIKATARENDETLRELWTCLLANQLTEDLVHPEFIQILSRMSGQYARKFAEIVNNQEKVRKNLQVAAFSYMLHHARSDRDEDSLRITQLFESFAYTSTHETDFSEEQLINLRLVNRTSGQLVLTKLGEAFVKAVT
jgi:hypothetical protein